MDLCFQSAGLSQALDDGPGKGTHIVLVDVLVRELDDGVCVHRHLDFLAGSVEARARNGLNRDRILDDFVSSTKPKVAKATSELVDLFEVLHG